MGPQVIVTGRTATSSREIASLGPHDECCKYRFLDFDPLAHVEMLFFAILIFYDSNMS